MHSISCRMNPYAVMSRAFIDNVFINAVNLRICTAKSKFYGVL